MTSSCLIVLALIPAAPTPNDATIALENDRLGVEFSKKDGAITRVTNKKKSLDLISVATKSPRPWALLLAPSELVSDFTAFRMSSSSSDGVSMVHLRWETAYRITVHAEARLAYGSDELELRCSAENRGNRTILALRYPAIQGITTLSESGKRDRLLHSTMMGALFSDPFHLFHGSATIPAARGMIASRYPNGFHGSPLQLMAYYMENGGGFYFAARDGDCGDKDLNFYKAPDDHSLVCEIAHIQGDARAGKSLAVNYPVVVAALTEGSWYEAAERYRRWAVRQPWCKRGTRRQRAAAGDECLWLRERIGAVGMWWPFRDDIREQIRRTRRLYGAPLLHLELWWRHGPSHEVAQRGGDRFGPFYFPFLALKNEQTFAAHAKDALVPPVTPIAPDWIAMCPAQPGWREVVCESAEDMAGSQPLRHHQIWVDENQTGCRADCLYYDIGPCAGVPTHCYAQNHEHVPGAGHAITRAYVSLFEESQRRASRARGAYVPVGTECVSEPFVGCLDLYYARNAGFSPDMETFPYVRDLTWLPDGHMEIIPLFPFVYHEYGPMAVQGIYAVPPWDLSEAEDYFAWAEARAILWGGLIVSFPISHSPAPSAPHVHFLRSLVAARTDFAREFLAYGRMRRPPSVQSGSIDIDHGLAEGGWLRKIRYSQPKPKPSKLPISSGNLGQEEDRPKALSVEEWSQGLLAIPAKPAASRTFRSPSVLCQAYTLGDSRLGILLVNLRADAEEVARLPVDPLAYGLVAGSYELRRLGTARQSGLGTFPGRQEIELKLRPREVVLITATRVTP